MKLITKKIHDQLIENGHLTLDFEGLTDHTPVVKLFLPGEKAIWLLTEANPLQPNQLFGLFRIDGERPERSSILFPELLLLRGKDGRPVEREEQFVGRYPLSVYVWASVNHVVEDEAALSRAARELRERRP